MCSNFTTRMQEVKLHMVIDLVCFVSISIPIVRIFSVYIDKGFPCAIAL
jgi:hypothetical protein